MTTLTFLPDPGPWASKTAELPVTPRDVLNESAATAQDQQLTLAAENAPLRIIYGQVRLGPHIANVLVSGSSLVILAVWGHGEVDSFVSLEIDDKPPAAGVTWTHYTGTAGQTVNAALVAAFAAQSPPVTYTDALPGICYSVVTVPAGASGGFPRLNATIKGRKVYDARQNLILNSGPNQSWGNAPASVRFVTAPDGTTNAVVPTSDVAFGDRWQFTIPAGTYPNGTQLVYSFHQKTVTPTGIGGQVFGVSSFVGATYSALPDAPSEQGFTRRSWLVTITDTASPQIIRLYMLGVGGSDDLAAWGHQLEVGTASMGYTPTTVAAVNPVTAWSDNPALCLADFCSDTTYGAAKTVDWASVGSVAFDCDVLASGVEKMRTLNLAIDTVQPVQSWIDTLKTYAGCWVLPSSNGLKFVSDKAGSPLATFAHASGQIASISSIKKRGVQSTPTVMTVTYRDTSTTPHRDGTAVVYATGVLAGTTPRRESQVSLPGITRYSQAYREATERLNKLLLNDLSLSLGVFDEGLALEVGDIVSVTHTIGFTAKQLRVMGIGGDYGRFSLTLVEYDPAVYSAGVATAPTYTDTTLPNPSAPPAVTGVTMAEEVFQLENGTYSSRWRVTWSAATYAYLDYYRAELWAGSTLIHTGNPKSAEWPTPAVQEGVTYTAKIAAVSSIGATGTWATQSATAAGKTLIPGNVPSITAFEAGGTVYASWLPAVDIDIWRYEVRYGAVGVPWASTILIDRVDALRLTTDQLAVGTWTLHVKALDSVQQYSTTAATVTVTVTSDSAAFLIDTKLQTAPTLANMAEYALARTDANRYFVTEDGAAFGAKFASALSTYTSALATYHSSLTSTWTGEVEDFGLLLGGQWTGAATVADLSGSHTSYLGYSVDNVSWSYPSGLSQKVNARFAKLKHEALTTSTLLVTIPDQSIRVDAIPREEVGSGTSSAAGPVTITLTNAYVALKKLTITPQGTTARSATFDNVVLGAVTTFDVYIFNDAGTKIASAFQYQFQGV